MPQKAVLGHLQLNLLQDNTYELVDESSSAPTIIILHIDTVMSPTEDTLLGVVNDYKKCNGNKVLIDTTVEDFILEHFYTSTKFLEDNGVAHNDIFVLTGQVNTPMFQKHFNIPYTTFSFNLFENAYYNFLQWQIGKGYKLRNIEPRNPSKHFLSLIKNPRKLRRVFNAYFQLNDLYQYMIHSWHITGRYTETDWKDFKFFNLIDKEDDWAKIQYKLDSTKTIGDISGPLEWHIPDEVLNDVAVNLIHETHFFLDMEHVRHNTLEEVPWGHRYFITEKTYKNFALGLPFMNPGIAGSEQILKSYGYHSWDSMLGINVTVTNYVDCVKQYFDNITRICNMPISELNDILNSEKSIDMLKHNREVFFEQREYKRLMQILDTVYRL